MIIRFHETIVHYFCTFQGVANRQIRWKYLKYEIKKFTNKFPKIISHKGRKQTKIRTRIKTF